MPTSVSLPFRRAGVRTAIALLAALAGAGCASLQPARDAAPPPVELAAAWSSAGAVAAGGDATPPAGDGAATALADWWLRFDDPLLGRLVSDALRANASVVSAQAVLRQARALRDLAAAGLRPTLDGSASAQRAKSGGAPGGSSFTAAFDAGWEPDVFGGNRSAVRAADADAQASAASLGDIRISVAAEVAVGYITLRGVQVRLAVARDNLASQLDTLQITQWRLQAGLTTSLEAEQARAAAEQTRAQIPPLQTAVAQTAHALAVLTGRAAGDWVAADGSVEIGGLAGGETGGGAAAVGNGAADAAAGRGRPGGSGAAAGGATGLRGSGADRAGEDAVPTADLLAIRIPQPAADLALSLPAQTLRQRPDVRAAERQVGAALARLSQADAARYPSFRLSGSLGLQGLTLGSLSAGGALFNALAASVVLPLLDGGAADATVAAQRAALDQAQSAYRATVLAALQEVEDALVALRGDRERLARLRSATEAAANAALLARQRYTSGLVDFQTVLETQRTLLSTQDGVAASATDLSADHVRLYKALGGGWQPDAEVALAPADRRAVPLLPSQNP